jgi:hypothetical protein
LVGLRHAAGPVAAGGVVERRAFAYAGGWDLAYFVPVSTTDVIVETNGLTRRFDAVPAAGA